MRTSRGGGPAREGGIHTAKAVVLIAVLALIGVIVLAKSTETTSKSSASQTTSRTTIPASATTVPPATTTTTLVAPANIKLQVLNGVGQGGYRGGVVGKAQE